MIGASLPSQVSSATARGYKPDHRPSIFEVDISTQYLDIPTTAPNVLRVVPREVKHSFVSEPAAREFTARVLDVIFSRLRDFGGGVIWWRVKPELTAIGECTPCYGDLKPWGAYLRFTTSPELLPEDWERIKVLADEGALRAQGECPAATSIDGVCSRVGA